MPDPNARGIKALEDNTRALAANTKAVEAQTKLLDKLEKLSRRNNLQFYLEGSDVSNQRTGENSTGTDSSGDVEPGPYGVGTTHPYSN